MRDVVIETAEGWSIPLDGLVAERLDGEWLVLSGDSARIGFGPKQLPAAEEAAAARRTIETAVARRDGTLSVQFTDGETIETPPDPNVEAWEIRSSAFRVFALPGGGEPAIWDATSETGRFERGADPSY
jgi:hypothetical protein